MAIIDKDSDFVGEYDLPSSCYDNIEYYIDKYEKCILIDLLGAELYDLFIADLTALPSPQVPQTQRFLDIFDDFHIDKGNCIMKSEGIKAMLVQFVYFYAIRDLSFKKTNSGVIRESVEAAQLILKGFNDVRSYNQAVSNYAAIQWYICHNSEDFPEENGEIKCFIDGF